MKIKFFFFSLLLFYGMSQSQTVTIDLSTGKNDDGTSLNAPPPDVTGGVSVLDPDWMVVRPGETLPVTTKTRHTYSGWSTPTLTITTGVGDQSRWITDETGWAVTGDYIYTSKSFQIPNAATNATLNLRSLSFVRNWTYLVRTDVFPNTEEEITRTAWMSDGAKGWLNSRSPEVYNKPLIPGATYKIKVRVYTNNSSVTNALNVQGIVAYTSQTCSTPEPTVNSVVAYCQDATASPLTATGNNLLWYTSSTGGTGSSVAPIPDTSVSGTTLYYVSQTENGCESPRTSITVTVNQAVSPTFTQISSICLGDSFTLPATSNNGITGTWSPAINNQTTTTYTFTPTAGQCAITATMTIGVNQQVTPAFTQVDPICIGSGFTLPSTSINGITGTWSPAINNQATTTYTFTPTAGQCANTGTMTVMVTSTQFAGELIGMNAVNVNSQSTYTISNGVNGTWSSSNTAVGTIDATGEFTALSVGTTIISFVSSDCSNGVSKNVEVVNCNTPTTITFNFSTGKAGNNIYNNNNSINLPDLTLNTKDDDWKVYSSDFQSIVSDYANVTSGVIPNPSKITYPFNVNNTTYPSYSSNGTIDLSYSGITRGNFVSRDFYIPNTSYNRRIAIQGFAYRMNNISLVRKLDNVASPLTATPGTSVNNNWSYYSQNLEYNTCKKTTSTTTGSTDCSLNTKGENNIFLNINNRYNDKYLENSGEYYFDVRDWGSNISRLITKVGAVIEYTIDDLCIQVPYGETTQAFCDGATVSDLVAKNLDATEKDIKWYLSSTGGVALDPFATLTNGIYYAGLTFNGVTSLNRLPVKVEILPSAIVNENKDLALSVNDAIQIPVQGVTNGTWQSLDPTVATVSANGLVTALKLGKTAVRYTINNGKCSYDIGVVVRNIDYTLSPNSFIFDINSENDGLYIPVKKAYAMWRDANGLLNDTTALTGTAKAEVYWEDVSGLIRSTDDYNLPIVDAGENAKIKVHIDKSKGKGNAVVAYIINDKIVWSWHVWVTDDPTNGVNYGHVSDNERDYTWAKNARYEAGSIVKTFIPKWMDRNLGATNRDFIGKDWFKSGGLSYQWGRKDPFPSFIYKNGAMNEVSGSIGVKKHLYDYTKTNAQILDQVNSYDVIEENIKYSVNNPLAYIYSANGMAWFVNNIPDGDNNYRKKIDLWGDNSENATNTLGSTINSFKAKKPYDPCPNGWRIPSHLNNTAAATNYFSPWGRNRWKFWDNITGTGDDAEAGYDKIKPIAVNSHLEGVKIYANLGMDFTKAYTTSAIGSGKMSRNMGIYPGGGKYKLSKSTQKLYLDDTHEIVISTATMWNMNTANTYFMYGYADAGQEFDNDVNYPNMIGRYYLNPGFESGPPKGANSCRCIEDKYAFTYNFPTEFFKESSLLNYTEGMSNPNSYAITKGTAEQEVKIPISKAFSVYNQHLSDHGMLEFNNLKANVYWTDNKNLISNVKIINAPSSISNIKDAYISVKITADQSGNAVVSLHNGSLENPVYWSWHIWVTNSTISEVRYQTEDVLLPPNANYVNFTNSGAQPMNYSFMDRNLGAIDAFPNIVNSTALSSLELEQIGNSAGLQYQWGRKDPIPSFRKAGISFGSDAIGNYSIWKSSGPDANGNIIQSSFTEITDNMYDNTYVKKRDIDYGTSGNNKREKLRNNLKYASENPLAFLIPGNFYNPISGFTGKYGQDWLYFESNQMPERWGNAGEKSVFDPCPSGYRIPFISNTVFVSEESAFASKSGKGSSPWYNGFYKSSSSVDSYRLFDLGIQQHIGAEIKNTTDIYNGGVPYYLGNTIKNGSSVYGFIFNSNQDTNSNPSAKYKIGNYPITGTRGYNQKSASVSGLWTASMQSNNGYGKGFNLSFYTPDFTTSNLSSLVVDEPANAMNCRCVKDDFYFGKALEIASNTGNIIKITEKRDASEKTSNVEYVDKEIKVYPNPVTSILNIKVSDNKDYYYKIYNMSGQLVKQGKFVNNQTDLSSLISGAYLVRINDSESVVKIIKK